MAHSVHEKSYDETGVIPLIKLIKKALFIILTAILLFMAGGYGSYKILSRGDGGDGKGMPPALTAKQPAAPVRNLYEINARLDPEKATLSAMQTLTFINRTSIPISEVFFNIYPNAYDSVSTAPVVFDSYSQVYPSGFSPGSIRINMVCVDDTQASFEIQGKDKTLLRVDLKHPLVPNATARIHLNFHVKLPHTRNRLGYYNDCYNFGNWYPILCVYRPEKGWIKHPFYHVGEPFFSEPSDYRINITVPENFVLGATAAAYKITGRASEKTWCFEIDNIRDFAWVTGPNFEFTEKDVDGIRVSSYFDRRHRVMGYHALNYVVSAVKVYNETFGKYPYTNISVIETEFPSAMEYPGLVMLSRSFYDDETGWDALEKKIIHEVAHQWWYNAIGNDQYEDPWIDEGLSTYSQVIYYEKVYGHQYGDTYYKELVLGRFNPERRRQFLYPVYRSKTWAQYYPRAYIYPSVMLHDLRQRIGDETFFEFIQKLFQEFCFRTLDRDGFLNALQRIPGFDAGDFIKYWFG